VTRFIVQRVVAMVIVLWLATMLTFLVFFMAPKALGSDPAVLYAGRSPSAATLEAVRTKLGLDKSVPEQYWLFVKGIVVGRDYDDGQTVEHCPAPCLGYSFRNSEAVTTAIARSIPVTASIAVGAAVIWLVTGVLTGVLSALKKGSVFDRGTMAVALAGMSLPIYFTGLLALSLISYKWEVIDNIRYVGITDDPLMWARNLLLAWICLAFLYAAVYARFTRASVLETAGEDFIRTARAKGLSERRVIAKHLLRPALTPILTILGLDVGLLLGGAVLTEKTFGMPGLGTLAINAVLQQDLPVLLGVTLFAAFFVVAANLIVDVLYALVNPRVRVS